MEARAAPSRGRRKQRPDVEPAAELSWGIITIPSRTTGTMDAVSGKRAELFDAKGSTYHSWSGRRLPCFEAN